MYIEEIELENFRRFNQLSLKKIPNNLVVFVGINGAGKSSILDAISVMLYNITLGLDPNVLDMRKGKTLENEDINNKDLLAKVRIKTNFGSWSISKQRATKNQKIELSQEIENYLSSIRKDWF